MAVEIPVTFNYMGRQYKGIFTDALGPNNHVWFLMVNNYHWGQLVYSQLCGWGFFNQRDDMRGYAEDFGEVVMAWYQ